MNKKVGYSGTVQDFDNYIGAVKVPKVEGVQQTKAPVLSAGVPDLSVNVKPPVNISPVAPLDNTRVQRPEVNLDVINRANDEFTVMDDKTINTELETLKKEKEAIEKRKLEVDKGGMRYTGGFGGMGSVNQISTARKDEEPLEFDQMKEDRLNRLTRESTIRSVSPIRQAVKDSERETLLLRQSGDNSTYVDIAEKLNKKTNKVINAPSKTGTESGISNWAQGIGDVLGDNDTWTSGVTEIARSLNLSGVAEKLNNNQPIDNKELLALEAYINYGLAQEARANDLSLAYKAGQISGQSIPFMAEMLVTAGIGSAGKNLLVKSLVNAGKRELAEKVARSLGGATVKEVTSEGIEQAVRLGATKTLGGKIAKEVGETVVQTAAMPHTWVKVQEDKLMNDLNNEEYGWKDFSRSFTDALQETATERVGGKLIDSAFGAV